MPDDAVRGIAVAQRVYQAYARGRVIRNYDLPAMRAFEKFGDERCGRPTGGYEMDVKVLD